MYENYLFLLYGLSFHFAYGVSAICKFYTINISISIPLYLNSLYLKSLFNLNILKIFAYVFFKSVLAFSLSWTYSCISEIYHLPTCPLPISNCTGAIYQRFHMFPPGLSWAFYFTAPIIHLYTIPWSHSLSLLLFGRMSVPTILFLEIISAILGPLLFCMNFKTIIWFIYYQILSKGQNFPHVQ